MSAIKKTIGVLLAVLMLVSLFSVVPLSAGAVVSGSSGDCSYTYDESAKKLTITGGTDFTPETGGYPWDSYRSEIKTVVIESGITKVGANAFKNCTNLTSVTLPSSIDSIENLAFSNCSSLLSVMLPGSLSVIRSQAFDNSGIVSLSLPTSLKMIAFSAFSGTKIKSVLIPKNTTRIDSSAFSNCKDLSVLTIPEGCKANIAEHSFLNTALKSVIIPSSVTTIGNKAIGFEYNNSTKEYTPVEGFKIYTDKASKAEAYAVENGFEVGYTQIISDVAVEDIVVPEIGEHPVFTCTLPEGVSLKDKVHWWDAINGDELKASATFKEGYDYYAEFELNVEDGYRFAINSNRTTAVTATVNGRNVAPYSYYSTMVPENTIGITIWASTLSETKIIDSITVTDVVEPEEGKIPSFTGVCNTEGVEIQEIVWENLAEHIYYGYIYEGEKQYRVLVSVKAKDGYEFKTKGDGQNPDVTATINGNTPDGVYTSHLTNDPKKGISMDYTFTAKASEVPLITNVAVTDIDEPVPGAHPDFTASVSSPNVLYEVDWYNNTDGKMMTASDVFKHGKKYMVHVYMNAAPGYKFNYDGDYPKITALINANIASVLKPDWMPEYEISVTTDFDIPPAETETVKETEPKETETTTDKPIETETVTEPKETETTTDKPIETETVTEPKETETTTDKPIETEPKETETATDKPIETEPKETETATDKPIETEPAETDPPAPSNDIRDFKVSAVKSKTYTGKAITQKITVIDEENNYTLVEDTDYIVTYSDNENVGTAKIIITATGDFKGSIIKTFKIKKAANPITVKTAAKSVKLKDVKKKTVTVKNAITVKKAKGNLTYTKVIKGSAKVLSISKSGKLTVKKGTKKGTYKLKFKVTAKGNKNYKSKTVTKTVTIKVK